MFAANPFFIYIASGTANSKVIQVATFPISCDDEPKTKHENVKKNIGWTSTFISPLQSLAPPLQVFLMWTRQK